MNDLTPLLFDYSAKSPEENIEIDKQLLNCNNITFKGGYNYNNNYAKY